MQDFRMTIDAHVGVRPIESALHIQKFCLRPENCRDNAAIVLLTAGYGTIVGCPESIDLVAPAVTWLPSACGEQIRICAGGQGFMAHFSDLAVKDAIGDGAESVALREMAGQIVIADSSDQGEALGEMEHSLCALRRESSCHGHGSWVFLVSHLSVLLVHFWRLSGLSDSRPSGGNSSLLLQRFRHLVEIHFRDRWTIRNYADALSVSHDRLHDLCMRALQRTPLSLVHDRLSHEAAKRLARSSLTIERIANDLGFPSASHFGRFFQKNTGHSPARFRAETRAAVKTGNETPARTYADWP
jgi:AraC-like DNA-binding protein